MLACICLTVQSLSASSAYNLDQDYEIFFVPDLNARFYVDDIPDGIKWHLKQGIYWESNIGRLIREHTKCGGNAVDIGAHIGIHSITMSRKVGRRGRVYSFEPQEKMFFELNSNLELNHCSNVRTLRQAIGEVGGVIELNQRDPENEGGTAIGAGGDQAELITLDSMRLLNISLIKIDVERYELHVLKGAFNTIRRNQPVIIFELMSGYDYNDSSSEIREQFDAVFDFLESLGYTIELIFGADYIAYPRHYKNTIKVLS